MKTHFQPVPRFRPRKWVAPAGPSFPDHDEARALAEAIVETIREPLLVLDEERRVVTANRSFRHMFGVDRREVRGQPLHALGGGRWNAPELASLLATVVPTDVCDVEADVPGMGRRTMRLNARRLSGTGDARALVLLAIEDISERRADERRMAGLLQRNETLLQEMQHRIANSLQIIASILLMKARGVQSEEARSHLNDTHRRIMSVAAVQQQLGIERHGERIELGPYLSRLCETLAASLIGVSRPISIEVQADGGKMSSKEIVSIGLIVTELVINALKHAFVDDTVAGRIVVACEMNEPGWRLDVSDNGVGMSAGAPDKAGPGLGAGIVEALAGQLDARVETSMRPDGTSVSITHGPFRSAQPRPAGGEPAGED